MASETVGTPSSEPSSGKCSFCGQDSGPTRRLVRAPHSDALICRSCAETVITTLEANPSEDRRHEIIGACAFVVMILLGVGLVWHFLFGTGKDYVIGSVATGVLLVMGAIPMYLICFRSRKN